MSDKEIMDAIDDIKRGAEEQQEAFDRAMEYLDDVTAERDRLRGEVAYEKRENKELYRMLEEERYFHIRTKEVLSAMEDVVEAAKQLNAAMNLSMDVKTYKALLEKALAKLEDRDAS